MSRRPNDDRSDSKNPNNSAYWASQSNHAKQTGAGADYEDEDFSPAHIVRSSVGAQQPLTSQPRAIEVYVTSPVRMTVRGLNLLCISERKSQERHIIVDSPSIDDAVREAQVLWDAGGWSYLALYEEAKEGGRVHLELCGDVLVPDAFVKEVCALGDLNGLVRMTEGGVAEARRALDSCAGRERSHGVMAAIKEFGAWTAALDALQIELNDKLAGLAERGLDLSHHPLDELAASAKRGLLAATSAARIRSPKRGFTDADLSMSLAGAQTIASLRPA